MSQAGIQDLQKAWSNLKMRAKAKNAAFQKDKKKTGGGSSEAKLEDIYVLVLNIIGENTETLNPFDCEPCNSLAPNAEMESEMEMDDPLLQPNGQNDSVFQVTNREAEDLETYKDGVEELPELNFGENGLHILPTSTSTSISTSTTTWTSATLSVSTSIQPSVSAPVPHTSTATVAQNRQNAGNAECRF